MSLEWVTYEITEDERKIPPRKSSCEGAIAVAEQDAETRYPNLIKRGAIVWTNVDPSLWVGESGPPLRLRYEVRRVPIQAIQNPVHTQQGRTGGHMKGWSS
jgi:hypothetical protein